MEPISRPVVAGAGPTKRRVSWAPGPSSCAAETRSRRERLLIVAARAGQPQSLEFARAIALCRVFSLGFWSQAFAELKARSGSAYVGVVVLAVETVAVVLAVELLAAASPKSRNKKD